MTTGTADFGTTLWSEVHGASDANPARRRAALESLAQAYWSPLYEFARRRGLRAEDAQDAVQEFFSRLIERNGFASADPARGRFRTWLRASFSYFLADAYDRARALKRGGDRRIVSLEVEPAAATNREFDRDWARLVLRRAMDALQAERAYHVEMLRETLGAESPSMKELAARYGLSEQDVKNRLFRARRRLRELLLAEVRGHVENPADADQELRDLGSAIS
jgi:RNA polymerase sigma factor (sigma-70 family)